MVNTAGGGIAAPHRFIALDSLRGIAAVFIVFFHMGAFGWIASWPPFTVGWLLVDFFFVLSGFVIAASYGGRLAMGYPRGGFLLVRLGRVYPLHILTVAIFVALEFALFRPLLGEAHPYDELFRGIFLLDAFVTGAGNFYAPVSWAVGVEMVLYGVAALLFGRGRLGVVLAALLAFSSAWALLAGFNEVGFGRLLQRGLLAFPLGVLAFWLHGRLASVSPGRGLLTLAELALVAAFLWALYQPAPTAARIPALALLYAAMVLVFARDGGLVARALHWRPLVWLGQMSFALYMVHLFWIILPNRLLPKLFAATGHADWIARGGKRFGLLSLDPPPAVATLISLGLFAGALGTAWLAWRFVEEPTRHWTRRFAPPRA